MTAADVSGRSKDARPGPGIGSTAGRESARDEFYDHLLHVCLLMLLQESSGTSADLRQRLRPLGFEQSTAAADRALDALSAAGLIRALGDDPPRIYAVTPEGSTWLRGAARDLRRTEVVLGGFLARCGDRLLSS